MDRTLSGTTTLGHRRPGRDGNEGVFHIPKGSSITEASSLNYFVLYPGHSLGETYPSIVMQSLYYTAQTTGPLKFQLLR